MTKQLNLTHIATLAERLTAAVAEHGDHTWNRDPANRDDWHRRMAEADDKLKETVINLGGVISNRPAVDIAVRLGGLRASSTSGIAGACRNWLTAAKNKLEALDT